MLDPKLLKELQEYVELHREVVFFNLSEAKVYADNQILDDVYQNEIEDFIKTKRKPTFNQVLFRFIDKKSANDSDVYKKAGIDRRHFSKIRSNPEYKVGKNTAIALAFALELNMDDAEQLLSSAGYSLSESETFDLVIQFFLEKKIYDIDEVNQALDYFSLKPLIGIK